MSNIIDFCEYKRNKQRSVTAIDKRSPFELMQEILLSALLKN